VWVGGLVGLGLFLAHARRAESSAIDAARVVARWSAMAAFMVIALVVNGTILAWYIGGPALLRLDTTYAWLLATKVGLVTVALGIASWNRLHLLPALLSRPDKQRTRRLTRTVIVEAGVLVMTIGVTAALVSQNPRAVAPRPAAPVSTPFSAALGDHNLVRGVITPTRVGTNLIDFDLVSATGVTLKPTGKPLVTATMPSTGLGPLDGSVARGGQAGRYRASIALPVAGEWRVEISVQTDAFSDEVADIAVRVTG
jgi:copper transport protein